MSGRDDAVGVRGDMHKVLRFITEWYRYHMTLAPAAPKLLVAAQVLMIVLFSSGWVLIILALGYGLIRSIG